MQLYNVVSNSFGLTGVNVIFRGVPLFLIPTWLSILFILYTKPSLLHCTIPITTTTKLTTNFNKYHKLCHFNLRLEIKRCKASKNSSDIMTFFCKLKSRAILILLSEKLCQQNKVFCMLFIEE